MGGLLNGFASVLHIYLAPSMMGFSILPAATKRAATSELHLVVPGSDSDSPAVVAAIFPDLFAG